jgi:hypothetical protein
VGAPRRHAGAARLERIIRCCGYLGWRLGRCAFSILVRPGTAGLRQPGSKANRTSVAWPQPMLVPARDERETSRHHAASHGSDTPFAPTPAPLPPTATRSFPLWIRDMPPKRPFPPTPALKLVMSRSAVRVRSSAPLDPHRFRGVLRVPGSPKAGPELLAKGARKGEGTREDVDPVRPATGHRWWAGRGVPRAIHGCPRSFPPAFQRPPHQRWIYRGAAGRARPRPVTGPAPAPARRARLGGRVEGPSGFEPGGPTPVIPGGLDASYISDLSPRWSCYALRRSAALTREAA